MRIDKKKLKRLLLLNFPYIFVGLIATNIGEGWRLAEGANSSEKLLSFMTTLPAAFQTPLPSFHPLDLLIGILCGAALRLAVYLKGKNAKKYRHNTEYGSARWVINNCGNGWNVGRTTAEGLRQMLPAIRPSEAKPGDIIFFQGTYDTVGASHVGIYVGNGMMIHCGSPIQYASVNSDYFQRHFMCYCRLP